MIRKILGYALSALVLLAGAPPATALSTPRPAGGIAGPFVAAAAPASPLNIDLRRLPQTAARNAPHAVPLRRAPAVSPAAGRPLSPAGAAPVQNAAVTAPLMPSPLKSFAGISLSQFGGSWPPDPNGDVGPVYYIQTVNTAIGVFTKTTGALAAGFTFNTFFSGAGALCGTNNQGDPIVVHDAQADRWLISDFAYTTDSSHNPAPPYYQCIAVSQTSDPLTGGWYRYSYPIGTVNGTAYFNDYTKFAVWSDAIYMTSNMFASSGSYFVRVWAWDKTALYAGQPLSGLYYDVPSQYASLLPANLHGQSPPAGAPEYLTSIGIAGNLLNIWKFKPDFATPANSTFSGPLSLAVGAFTANAIAAPQLGVAETLDLVNDRQMMQLQYRRIGNVESLWAAHTVDSGGATGIRWYEVRDPNGSPYIYQQGAYQPDGGYRFMPSLAVDRQGNMAVGYSVSSSAMRPAIRYAGRLAGDPLNTLGQGETSLVEGTGSQQNGYGRWGDYSAMTIDPTDDCTFWYTNEYYIDTGANWQTRIGSFRFPGCTNASVVVSGTVSDALTGAPLNATLSIAGYAGGTISTNPATGYYSVTLAPATPYAITATASVSGYLPMTRTVGPLSADSTQNFALPADTVVCNAPGYAYVGGIMENLDSAPLAGLPAAWASTVVTVAANRYSAPAWFVNAGTRYPPGYPAHSPPNLVLFNSYSSDAGDAGRLSLRGPIDMTSVNNTDLTLWVFHDTGYPKNDDYVQVQVSTDGGTTWANAGAPLHRRDGSTGWSQHTVSLAAYSNARQLLLGFLGVSAWGNDVHLDDIALGSPLGCSPAGWVKRAYLPVAVR